LNQPTLSIYTFEEGNNETSKVGWFGCSKKKNLLKILNFIHKTHFLASLKLA
jgi:hypothetical protein